MASSSYVISTNTDLFFFHRHSLPPKSLPTLFLIHPKKSPPPILSLRSSSNKKRLSAIKAAANTSSAFNGFPTLQNLPAGATEAGFLRRLLSVLPGGSWWSLEEFDAKGGKGEKGEEEEKSMPVMLTLRRMWVLIARERWVVALAFASLVLASITDLSIPHFLAAALFSAQSSERLVFYRSAKLLLFLCFSSAIFSGLRSCCFGFANMILVKRMRERLYHALLFQDMSFFDEETVGNLTSRLGSDCQQVSRVIGNDLNLITRSLLQGTGALIYLFILSWPLALSTVAICSVFGIILLFHGQYQKRAAKISQEFTACSNEVSQESLSLMRTVRVYGTEEQEFRRQDILSYTQNGWIICLV
ncbi:putative ABC transporter B family member 26, chloroplastic [Iris pallida]|uniref:ABC transporter B family member 26, chloroplastic n=1 Tax=Iris pallida TaxID=29817 RepID=A0AAX6HKC3_IRIPA|nr:putative ABC transporter B family member 26, chloroplastic [Iris pallida]KAJ6841004.1 putative ABC transporter B family member 26, chloroplastic [Iris pallida]